MSSDQPKTLPQSWSEFFFKLGHMVVCRAAQENRACTNYVSILTGTTKSRSSRIHNSTIFYPKNIKVAVEVAAYQGRLHTKFEENRFRDMSEQTFQFFFVFFFFIFLHAWKNFCNSKTRTSIQLKFGTLVEHPEVIISINFRENMSKILRVITNRVCKTRTIFRHVYRVNHWLDQPENWYVARFNIRGVPFGG